MDILDDEEEEDEVAENLRVENHWVISKDR